MSPAIPMTLVKDREIVVERTFDAPRELVWAALTNPKHLDQFWGPNGFRNATSEFALKKGGYWRYVMHGPDGKDWINWIRFEEIVKHERLVYDHGGETDAPAFHVTVTLEKVGAKTRLTMQSVFPTPEALEAVKKFGAVEGGYQNMARLSGHLLHMKAGTEGNAMVLTRTFDAPVELVFQAWASGEAIKRWWGPKVFTCPEATCDFREGGSYRIVMRAPDGTAHPVSGIYREIIPNRRIVMNAVIEQLAGLEVNLTVDFVADGDKTILTVRSDKPDHEAAAKGQTQGWSETLEKLAAALRAA